MKPVSDDNGYIEFEGDFFSRFKSDIGHYRISANYSYFGTIKRDKFYFGKTYYIKNPYRTVICGEIEDNSINYRFRKDPEGIIAAIIKDIVGIVFGVVFVIDNYSAIDNRIVILVPSIIILCLVASDVPFFIYSKSEKEILLNQLKKMCKKMPV